MPITGESSRHAGASAGISCAHPTNFVNDTVAELAPPSDNAVAVLCASPNTIRRMMPVMDKLGFTPENVFTTLENRMKCGLGKCGRCNTGKSFICKDGPVYTFAQLRELPVEY